ncbi:hypothetical protein FB45DRAFT_899510 [Roridomyces roridus]|uniref:F-box domain-containing protein n=1 Tax=Roridomyces roridus TaxID=1738132 RepID=A0AAD7FWB8_9AGAR|nr:hypothetical protein FB45DRAFT_899510 [Roridomyces roridus]
MTLVDSKTARAADRSRIVTIDAEVQELETRLHLLHVERDEFQKRLDAYKYPVLILPNEIVSEIFVHTLPPYPVCPSLTGLSSPIPLTHICRKWREIAVFTPQLWRAICVISRGRGIRRKQTVVRTWLERSGSCPLSIRIETYMDNHPVLEEILLRHNRWEHVNVLPSLFKGPMTMLRTLSMDLQDGNILSPAVTPADFPRLQTVSLTWFRKHVDWLPWAQLTSLTLEYMDSLTFIPILRDAIHLIDLAFIECDLLPSWNAESPADIPLTQLTSLVMLTSDVQILEVISAPALQRLRISAEDLGDKPVGTLGPLISRSGFKLQKLLITGDRRGWPQVSKRVFRSAFPTIPEIAFNSKFRMNARQEGDEEDSGDSDEEDADSNSSD